VRRRCSAATIVKTTTARVVKGFIYCMCDGTILMFCNALKKSFPVPLA
jgi:hypothetical protein